MRISKKSMAGALLITSFSLFAADDCAKKSMTSEVDICYQALKNDSETRLNTEYQALRKRVAADYAADKKLGEEYSTKLLSAQRHWLKYREQQCAIESFIASPDSQASVTLTNICVSRINEQRILEMKTLPY